MSDLDCSDAEEYSYSNDSISDHKRHARTQHNELERRRRNNIKDMYNALKDSIPGMKNERASRAVILKKAVELISNKKKNLDLGLSEIKDLENEYLELQKELAALEGTNESSEPTGATTGKSPTPLCGDSIFTGKNMQKKLVANVGGLSGLEDFVPPDNSNSMNEAEYMNGVKKS